MIKVYCVAALIFCALALLLAICIGVARRAPTPVIGERGDGQYLHIGDYINLWGTPTGISSGPGDIDISWDDVGVDVDTDDFTPFSAVSLIEKGYGGARWRGFVSVP